MSREINHNESFEAKGKWRCYGPQVVNPKHPSTDTSLVLSNEEFCGTLTYNPDKKQLMLRADFCESSIVLKMQSRSPESILLIRGRTTKGYVYLFDCLVRSKHVLTKVASVESVSFLISRMLVGDEPLIKEEEDKARGVFSWYDLRFTKASVEYANLSFWGGGIRMTNNSMEVSKGTEDTLKMEMPVRAEKKIGTTLAYRISASSTLSMFQDGIYGHMGIKTRAQIDFDFDQKVQGTCLEEIIRQVEFFQRLLHFAMLPHVSTHLLSMRVSDREGNIYQFFKPTFYLPKREKDVGNRLPGECFIPSWHADKIGECFEKYKHEDSVDLLFDLFIKPSYAADIDIHLAYMNTFMVLECAYKIMNQKEDAQTKDKVKFLIDELPEEIKNSLSKKSMFQNRWKDEKVLIKDLVNVRNDIVHVNPGMLKREFRENAMKIAILYEYLIYKIQRKIFGLSDKEIRDDLSSLGDENLLSLLIPRYPFYGIH